MFEFQLLEQNKAIDQWNYLALNKSSLVSVTHNPSLFHFYSNFLSLSPFYFILHFKNEPVGLLTLIDVGSKIISIPHFSGGGVLWLKNIEIPLNEAELLLHLSSELNDSKIKAGFYQVEITRQESAEKSFPSVEVRSFNYLFGASDTKKTVCLIHLEKQEKKQFEAFKSNLRRKINKAEKNGIHIRSGGLELLEDFTQVYNRNMHRIGSPTLGKQFFKALLDAVNETILFVAYLNEKPIGSSFVMWYDGYVENTWFSTVEDYNQLYTSYILHWATIKWAINNKAHTYSMGRSTIGSGTHHYKLQWPVEDKLLYLNQNKKSGYGLKDQRWATRIWKHLPAIVVDKIGPFIAKRIY